ncbi:fimbrial protein TafA [Haloarcula sp. H-GB5]
MNRRNVLTGLGGLAISGGALFGTGAFTSVTATRSVEVNVFGADSGTDGLVDGVDQTTEDDIADTITSNAVDVLVDTSSSDVSVKGPDGNSATATNLFPANPGAQDGANPGTDGTYDNVSHKYVSLVANDVTIVFGENNGLPPNSTLGYNGLFKFMPNSDSNSKFNVTFGGDNGGTVLTQVDEESVSDGAVVSVSSSSSSSNAEITTETSNKSEDLDISITEQ